ncbi:alpha/beta hydrolase [Brevibacillus daliensis]|uniref:alpha/beta hydrolase n=1 Tax=Brevibacillus daliensis TaxID=2892995 RepID=UPI0021034450
MTIISSVTSTISPTTVYASIPAPTLQDDNPTGTFGDWYTGAVPPNYSEDKPVILFVQGLHSNYKTFYRTGGLYEAAYIAGYRTAFVQLKDAEGGDGGNIWTNGQVLADLIKKVAQHYEVDQLAIVAHSKGGIDTQAALVHYGAAPYVHTVHQLATPNRGSELADMAYSTWTSWLAAILGQKDDAVYSLQTSYMANFRQQTDQKNEAKLAKTYTSAGTGDDGWFSATWFAHAVLPGQDDGAVSTASAHGLPYGINHFTLDISHDEMTDANYVWDKIESRLSYGMKITDEELQRTDDVVVQDEGEEKLANMILRGGEIAGKTDDFFLLESGVEEIMIDVMTADKRTKVKLISPSGKIYSPKIVKPENNKNEKEQGASEPPVIFQNAVHNGFMIDTPEAGKWSISMNGKQDAYFMYAQVESDSEILIKGKQKLFDPGEQGELLIESNLFSIQEDLLHRSALIKTDKLKVMDGKKNVRTVSNKRGATSYFEAPRDPGIYNLCLEITAVNERGEEFSRSVIYNFAVGKDID